MPTCGQVRQPVSIKAIINDVRDVFGIPSAPCWHIVSLTTILLCDRQRCRPVVRIIWQLQQHRKGHGHTPASCNLVLLQHVGQEHIISSSESKQRQSVKVMALHNHSVAYE